jgi:3',5'-nucleoside bisphosphate phosphatase
MITSRSDFNNLVDLHTHTSMSDGTVDPGDLISLAKSQGIGIIAITDHDTIAGNAQACATAEKLDLTCIPGMEISANGPYGSIHVLGLGLYHPSPELHEMLDRIQTGRRERNPMIVRKLQLLGYAITMEEVKALAGGNIIGRPHIAQSLMQHGYVTDQSDAFKRFLNSNAEAYVQRWRPEIDQAAEAIITSGGVPVLAHPGLIPIPDGAAMKRYFRSLKSSGLQGLEVHYPTHSSCQHEQLQSMAENLGLITTGGSDFHGDNKPGVLLGRGTNGDPITIEFVEPLCELLKIPVPFKQ